MSRHRIPCWTTVALIFLAVATLDAAVDPGLPEVGPVLDRIRAATGHAYLREWEYGFQVEGDGRVLGLDAQIQLLYLPDGRYRHQLLCALPLVEGYDGKEGWMVDYSGMPMPLEYTFLEVRQILAWVLGGHWLDQPGSLSVELAEDQGTDGKIHLSLAGPAGLVVADLAVEPRSYLPTRLTWSTHEALNRAELKDYREVSGFRFPHRILVTEEGQQWELRALRVRPATRRARSACRPITRQPRDTDFLEGIPGRVDLERLSSGHLLVHPTTDGQDPGWFLLDTGAGRNVIDGAVAERLGMPRLGEIPALGAGGAVKAHFRQGQSLILGPARIRNPVFIGLDLGGLSQAFDRRIGGLLGYDFLARTMIYLDLAGSRLEIYEPGTWSAEGIHWEKIVFHGSAPALTCRFAGGPPGLFYIDTGAPGTVKFSSIFVERHSVEFQEEQEASIQAGGLGGSLPFRQARLDWFELGDHRFESPWVEIAEARRGVFADRNVAGVIGTGFLENFILLLDYQNKRIGFVDRP